MKIKANRSFYRNVIIAFAGLLILIGSFSYFLGFDVNVKTLSYYGLFLAFVMMLSFLVFVIIDIFNRKYFIFDEEKIIEKNKNNERIVVYYNQIFYTEYHNKIDIFFGIIDFGYAEIACNTYVNDENGTRICIYLSKKHYKKYLLNNPLISNKK